MKNVFDISDFVQVTTIQSVLANMTVRVKDRRKELKLSQKKLAETAGVSYACIRRFESKGEISLGSLLKIAMALRCLEDFNKLFDTPIVINVKDYKL